MIDVFYYMEELKNVNEKRVWQLLSEYIEANSTEKFCLCGICLSDIVAITLNNIPSQYQKEEGLSASKEKVSDAEIYRQLKKAILTVSKHPHH